jgi:hypothetical protein
MCRGTDGKPIADTQRSWQDRNRMAGASNRAKTSPETDLVQLRPRTQRTKLEVEAKRSARSWTAPQPPASLAGRLANSARTSRGSGRVVSQQKERGQPCAGMDERPVPTLGQPADSEAVVAAAVARWRPGSPCQASGSCGLLIRRNLTAELAGADPTPRIVRANHWRGYSGRGQ